MRPAFQVKFKREEKDESTRPFINMDVIHLKKQFLFTEYLIIKYIRKTSRSAGHAFQVKFKEEEKDESTRTFINMNILLLQKNNSFHGLHNSQIYQKNSHFAGHTFQEKSKRGEKDESTRTFIKCTCKTVQNSGKIAIFFAHRVRKSLGSTPKKPRKSQQKLAEGSFKIAGSSISPQISYTQIIFHMG